MAARIDRLKMRVSAQDATTVTLVPADGEHTVPDLSDDITSIVVTMTARDTQYFDIVNRFFYVSLSRV